MNQLARAPISTMKSFPKGAKLAFTRIATKLQSDVANDPADPQNSALYYALPKLLLARIPKNHPDNKGSKMKRKNAQTKYTQAKIQAWSDGNSNVKEDLFTSLLHSCRPPRKSTDGSGAKGETYSNTRFSRKACRCTQSFAFPGISRR
jgi:hypothetical protein